MPRTPDYWLKIKEKEGTGDTVAGAAWDNKDGSISIDINPCVVLSRSKDLMLRLFPNNREKE